jgi:hypothetical protein
MARSWLLQQLSAGISSQHGVRPSRGCR